MFSASSRLVCRNVAPGLFGLALLLPVALAGCSGSKKGITISGKVNYKGNASGSTYDGPVTGGHMKLTPTAKGDAITVTIQGDGTFKQPDVPAGTYKVTFHTEHVQDSGIPPEMMKGVTPPKDMKMPTTPQAPAGSQMKKVPLPAKYADINQTTETWEIKKDTAKHDFNLTD
jgi:hypothetical protein